MKCPVYQSLRNIYLPNIDIDQDTVSVDHFYSLFNRSRDEVLNLSKYIYYAFRMREDKVKELQG